MLDFGQARLVTETATVCATPCRLVGFYVASTSSGTLVIHDSASAATNAITGTITPAVGWHFLPAALGAGLRVVAANTISVTFVYQP